MGDFSPPAEPYKSEIANALKPPTLYRPYLAATLGLTKILVQPDLENPKRFNISWLPQQGALRYFLYAYPAPIKLTIQRYAVIPKTQTTATFEMPIILPGDMYFYFWVSYENAAGAEVFISDEPSYDTMNGAFEGNPLSVGTERDIISNADMKFYSEEIRRRHLAMLENDSEFFYLYIRRMHGQPCICITSETGKAGRIIPMHTTSYEKLGTQFDPSEVEKVEAVDATDPEYGGAARCPYCLGTGIAGGYYPKIKIMVRYGNIPPRILRFQEQGVEFRHDFNSWTIWHPHLKERDLLVRLRTGERFYVNEPSQSEWRGITLHQQFKATSIPDTDIAYSTSDQNIIDALVKEGAVDIAKWNWALYS